MGTVASEKAPSIHGFIKEACYQRRSLCIRITERLLVNQVGYGKKQQEFGLFQMLLNANAGIPENVATLELVLKTLNTSKERKRLQMINPVMSQTGNVL